MGLPSSDKKGLQKKFHVFPIMKEPLQRSEEIKGELPFFMPAHLLAVGSLILGHKENGVFMSTHTHTPAGHKVAFTVGVLILCGWWGAVGVQTPTLNAPPAVKFNCCFLGSASCGGGGGGFMTDRPLWSVWDTDRQTDREERCCLDSHFFVWGYRARTLIYI